MHAAPLEDDLAGHASANGVLLHVIRDWSGRPAVTAHDAAALAAATEMRAEERATTQRRSQADQNAASWAGEREIATAARSVHERVLADGARHGDRDGPNPAIPDGGGPRHGELGDRRRLIR